MYSIITILAVIVGILLGAIVLIQNPKGGGLNSSFGGVGQQLLGARRSTDVVEKTTWGLAAGLLFLCLISVAFIDKKTVQKSEVQKSEVEEMVAKNPVAVPSQGGMGNQPAQPAQPAAQPQP